MNRRRFLKSSLLCVSVAPTMIRAAVIPSHKHISIVTLESDSSYVAKAVSFDGSTYLVRGGALTGAANGFDFSVSVWIKPTAGDGTARFLLRETGGFVEFQLGTDNKPNLAGSPVVASNLALSAGSGWHHIAIGIKASTTQKYVCYIDGADHKFSGSGTVITDFTQTNWGVGANHVGGSPFTGSMSDLWFAPSFVDFSDSATLQKFRSLTGKPVNLGSDGSTPTGTSPIIFLSGDATSFATNKGTGGGMTVGAGSLTTDSNGP